MSLVVRKLSAVSFQRSAEPEMPKMDPVRVRSAHSPG